MSACVLIENTSVQQKMTKNLLMVSCCQNQRYCALVLNTAFIVMPVSLSIQCYLYGAWLTEERRSQRRRKRKKNLPFLSQPPQTRQQQLQMASLDMVVFQHAAQLLILRVTHLWQNLSLLTRNTLIEVAILFCGNSYCTYQPEPTSMVSNNIN